MRLWGLVLALSSLILLAGCATVKEKSIVLEEYELGSNDGTEMTLSFHYTTLPASNKPESFHVQFITGDYLEVKTGRYGQTIGKDVIRNATGTVQKKYWLSTKGYPSGQEVETVQAVITSSEGSLSFEVTSDFVLIRR